MRLRILLDSTYLLPTFGVGVVGLTDEDIKTLRELAKDRVQYFCASIVWVEILGKIYKEASKRDLNVDHLLEVGVKSLISSGFYKWIEPSVEAIKLAFELRKKGHRDMVDNILYGIAKSQEMIFLTMDSKFMAFLRKNGFSTENVIDHKKLIDMIYEKSSGSKQHQKMY